MSYTFRPPHVARFGDSHEVHHPSYSHDWRIATNNHRPSGTSLLHSAEVGVGIEVGMSAIQSLKLTFHTFDSLLSLISLSLLDLSIHLAHVQKAHCRANHRKPELSLFVSAPAVVSQLLESWRLLILLYCVAEDAPVNASELQVRRSFSLSGPAVFHKARFISYLQPTLSVIQYIMSSHNLEATRGSDTTLDQTDIEKQNSPGEDASTNSHDAAHITEVEKENKEADAEAGPAAPAPVNPMMDPSSFPDGGLQAWLVVLGCACALFVSFGSYLFPVMSRRAED